jgi:hypothetical protein
MAAAAAAEIVREIAAVGAADLAAAADPLRADCLRLARKVSLLSHLVAEVADAWAGAGAGDAAAEAEAEAWLRDLVRALEAARRFVALGRTPAAAGASDQVRRCWDGLVWLHGPVRSTCIAFFTGWCVSLRGILSNASCAVRNYPVRLLGTPFSGLVSAMDYQQLAYLTVVLHPMRHCS